MRSKLLLLVGGVAFLLGPVTAFTQFGGPPGGGPRNGGSGFRMSRDPNERWNQMTGGKEVWVRSEITDQQQQGMFDFIARSLGVSSGQITRQQYLEWSAQWTGGRMGGGRVGRMFQPPGGPPPTPGASPAGGGPAAAASPGGQAGGGIDTWAEVMFRRFDRNGDGKLDAQELAHTRVILYGYSFGGAAVVKLARQLKEMGVPVLLTVQVDSVGLDDQVVPSNVVRAANFYQQNGLIIRGQGNIRAEDPTKTAILGNFKYKSENKKISDADFYWLERIVASSHTKMGSDPTVWAQVKGLILNEIK